MQKKAARQAERPQRFVSPMRDNISLESVHCVHSCHESDLRSVQDNPCSLLRVFFFISISDILDGRRAFGRCTDARMVRVAAACARLSHYETAL